MQKHQLTQKQSLRQIISQQTIQLMKLIELSNNGLEEEIMKELEENPALEVDHDEDQYEIDDSVPLDDEYDNPEDTDFDQSDEIESPFESDELKNFTMTIPVISMNLRSTVILKHQDQGTEIRKTLILILHLSPLIMSISYPSYKTLRSLKRNA